MAFLPERPKKAGRARSHFRTALQNEAARCSLHDFSRNFLYGEKTQPSCLDCAVRQSIPKCRCRRFSPTARGRSVPCDALLPSPGVQRRGHDIHEPTPGSCCENVGENKTTGAHPRTSDPADEPRWLLGLLYQSPRSVSTVFSRFHQRNLPWFGESPWVWAWRRQRPSSSR